MNMEQTVDNVIQWAKDRNIIGGATALAQQDKLEEEVKELRDALEANDGVEIVDAIGDSMVVLTIQAAILGLRVEDCFKSAYDTIKHRKGKLVNGKFIKQEDFEKYGISE